MLGFRNVVSRDIEGLGASVKRREVEPRLPLSVSYFLKVGNRPNFGEPLPDVARCGVNRADDVLLVGGTDLAWL